MKNQNEDSPKSEIFQSFFQLSKNNFALKHCTSNNNFFSNILQTLLIKKKIKISLFASHINLISVNTKSVP